MNRDRSWMNHNGVKDRRKPEYKAGVDQFLEFAFKDKSVETMSKCPCLNCRLCLAHNRKTMQCHLLVYGIDPSYNPWVSHGESEELEYSSEDENQGEILSSEDDEMPFDDMAPLVFDATKMYCALHMQINEPSDTPTQDVQGGTESLDQQDPLYVRLFERTKRHKSTDENSHWGPSGFGPNDEKHFEELKKIHEIEIENHGEDTLNVKDAYMKVFKNKSGYVRGLGPGARPPKKGKIEGDTNELRVEISSEIQQLKDAVASRESELETLKASNDDLRASNEELKSSNEELKISISKINLDAIEREKMLRADMEKMFDEIRRRR